MRLIALFALAVFPAFCQSLLMQAQQAHSAGDLAKERTLLETAASSGEAENRAEAERRMAVLAWRLHMDDEAAERHFDRASAAGARLPATLTARSRFHTARRRYEVAREFARRALTSATKSWDRDRAREAFATATVEEIFAAGSSAAAAEALALATEAMRNEPGVFSASRLVYGLALHAKNNALAQEALRSYYWTSRAVPLYPEAGLARQPADVVTYSRFCRRVREIAGEHYRLRALGKAQWTDLEPLVAAEARKAYPQFASEREILDHLRTRFGAVIGFFRFGLEFGHRVQEDNLQYNQHGHEANVRAVVIDSMISSGYTAWYSDGREIVGGWAADPIVRVRFDHALRAWAGVKDPERSVEFDREIARATAMDDATARKDPYAYLEGLHLRLTRRANRGLLQELEAKGLRGADLRLAFLDAWQRREDKCVFAHEARHLIDPRDAPFNREMTAAIARVLFGHPVQGLQSIFAPNIARRDGGTGEGNWNIMKGIVAWMKVHANEIKGLDPSRPLLPQFDLLTDEQIRAVFLTMDPLAPRS
jgi:hypothetical protein